MATPLALNEFTTATEAQLFSGRQNLIGQLRPKSILRLEREARDAWEANDRAIEAWIDGVARQVGDEQKLKLQSAKQQTLTLALDRDLPSRRSWPTSRGVAGVGRR